MTMGINERFLEIINSLYSGNKRAFAQDIGASPSVVENVVGTRQGKPSFDVLVKVCANAHVSAEWLLTGKGQMLAVTETQIATPKVVDQFPLKTDHPIHTPQSVPLYELDAVAGLSSLFDTCTRHIPVNHLHIPDLPPCDGALYVRGDSMYPLLKSGDIVLYKEVRSPENILWGEMYLLSFNLAGEQYISIKYIQKADTPGLVRLVSHNPHHAPKDIPLDSINALALVKASVRFNTMG